ncbi:hypothetical protein [Streptomyces sp. NBC_00454]|uniref:hypothetical protein n=1 Tax=Streptomyces sp. NBC_00454 TaxID=2975747 RepID=UPI003252235D
MTTPPPHQPPGPYGPPQPPHPYGGQQYAPQPSPYPQQQPYAPQQAYPPQSPYPGQGAWGQPPMGQPPRKKNRTGMVIGIIAASLVGLFVLTRVVAAGSVATGAGFPEAKYRLTLPQSMLAGEFKLDQDLSQTKGKEALKGSYDSKVRNPKPAVGQYTSDSASGQSALVVSGMYGQFKDPEEVRHNMLAGAAGGEGATLAVPAKDITPVGSDITMACQVLTMTQDGSKLTLPVCAWADENTGASVGVITPETLRQSPGSVDLDKVAATTLKVREETRKPIG